MIIIVIITIIIFMTIIMIIITRSWAPSLEAWLFRTRLKSMGTRYALLTNMACAGHN